MPLARAIPRIVVGLMMLTLGACAGVGLPTNDEFVRMPLAVRTGAANSVIERVETNVDRAEVAAAVQRLVTDAPICFPWPGLWLDASTRRNVYYARYDRMSRDWGSDVANASQQRMREFVDLGFLTAVERPDLGPGVVEYTLTADGVRFLRGSPYGGARPQFCPNAQRRVVEVTDMQWGQYPCGSLRVRFIHVADGYPTWARTDGRAPARRRNVGAERRAVARRGDAQPPVVPDKPVAFRRNQRRAEIAVPRLGAEHYWRRFEPQRARTVTRLSSERTSLSYSRAIR